MPNQFTNILDDLGTTPKKQPQDNIFGDLLDDIKPEKVEVATDGNVVTEVQTEKGFFAKSLDAGKKAIKWGLDVLNKVSERNSVANFSTREMLNGSVGQERLRRYASATTDKEKAKVLSESNQDVPLVKLLNTKPGKATIGFVGRQSSNILLKLFAGIQAIGSQTYDEAYSAWLAERNDPDNPVWQEYLYGLQDSGIQSLLGVVLHLGTTAVTRSQAAGYSVSSAYYTALSADEQLQERERVESLGNIGIDVLGDQVLNNALLGMFKKGGGVLVSTLKGAGIEGTTEITQSLLKYTNDYGNARTEEERQAVLNKAREYVTSGGMAMEFAISATTGGGISAGVSALNNRKRREPGQEPSTAPITAEVENLDFDAVLAEIQTLENSPAGNTPEQVNQNTDRLIQLRDTVNDYTTAFNDKTIFVPSEVSDGPLVEVTTSTLPSGKVVVKFSANTEHNGVSSTYDFNQQFSNQEQATKSATDAIRAWVSSQETQDPNEQAQLDKIIDYMDNPRSPIDPEVIEDESRQIIEQIEVEQERNEQEQAELDAKNLDELQLEYELAQEALEQNPARQLARFASRTTGRLPEVIGKGGKGRFAREGDDIAVNELGFEDSETARDAYDDYVQQKQRLAEIKERLDEKKTERREQRKAQREKQTNSKRVATDLKASIAEKKLPELEKTNAIFRVKATEDVAKALRSKEYKELSKEYKLKDTNNPAEGFVLQKKTVKDAKISGFASFPASDLSADDAPLPETGAAEIPIEFGQLDSVNPVELPEMVDIAREIMGKTPDVKKKMGKPGRLGTFFSDGGGRISILADLFKQKNLPQASKVVAHEIGHLIDYLPDLTMSRGNLLGRLGSLRGFMATTYSFDEGKRLPPKERARLRQAARKNLATELDKPQKDFTKKEKEIAKKRGDALIERAIEIGGYIKNETVKQELLTVTRWWNPYDPKKVPDSYRQYRESPVELYAEAISVLFNAPQRLQELAPTFYKTFFEQLDAKPEVRDAYFEVLSILSGDRQALIDRRRSGVQEMFKEGDYKAQELHNKRIDERNNRNRQYWSNFKHTVVSKNYQYIDRIKKSEKQGHKVNEDENPVFFLEERNYLGGKIKAYVEKNYQSIYETLQENEISWSDFGEMLFYQRISVGDRVDVANPRGITPQALSLIHISEPTRPY